MSKFSTIDRDISSEDTPVMDLKDNAVEAASNGLVVQQYCNRIIREKDIILPVSLQDKLPDVGTILKDAKSHASDYQNNLQPRVITLITDLSDYSNQFTAYQDGIRSSWESWKGGSNQGKEDLQALLEDLSLTITAKKDNAKDVAESLGLFKGQIDTDISNFNTTYDQAKIIIQGADGEGGLLATFEDELDGLNDQIAGVSVGIAVSGLAIIGGGLLILTGVLTMGATVVVGAALVAGGTAGMIASSKGLVSLLDSKSSTTNTINTLNSNLVFLKDMQSSISTLTGQAELASDSVGKMKDNWDIMGDNLQGVLNSMKLVESVSDLTSHTIFDSRFNYLGNSWGTVQDFIPELQKQMSGVELVDVKDAQGALRSIKESDVDQLLKAS